MRDDAGQALAQIGDGRLSGWVVRTLSRGRVQLAGALLIAVLLPGLFRWSQTSFGVTYVGLTWDDAGITNGLIGCGLACVLGFVTLRELRAHPGVTSASQIFYAFFISYGAMALALLFLRASYSRYQIAISLALTCAWFLALHRSVGRRTQLCFAVIPHPRLQQLPLSSKVRWLRLSAPIIDNDNIDGVVADLRADHDPEWERFMARCALAGLAVHDLKRISEVITGRVEISHMSENTFVSTFHGLIYGRLKRAVDLIAAVVVSPVFLLIIGVAAIYIRLDDGGPVLFTQVRMGHRGRPFKIYKLRTMRVDGDGGSAFTEAEDPRITRVGRFLRKYRIDEFPQIWNILKGEMSWIGPRPETIALSQWYEREVPFYSYRHIVAPGITGWAQVNQGNVAMVEAATTKLHYDFYYIKHLSPWLDLLIVARTVGTIFTGFGAL